MRSDNSRRLVSAIGNICADEYYQCLQDVRKGDKFFVRYLETKPGGMISNAACVMSALGTKTYFMSEIGNDSYEGFLLDSLKEYDVNTEYCHISSEYQNMHSAVLLSMDGKDRTIVLYETEKPVFVPDESSLNALKQSAFIYANSTDLKTLQDYRILVEEWKQAGVGLMLDMESSMFERENPEDEFFFRSADILSMNGEAFEKYCDSDLKGLDHLLTDEKVIIVTLGREGCIVRCKDEEHRILADDVPVKDTTGAGDTYNGAFLHYYLKGFSVKECAVFATAAAGLCVQSIGARGGAVSEKAVYRAAEEYKRKGLS